MTEGVFDLFAKKKVKPSNKSTETYYEPFTLDYPETDTDNAS